MKKMSLIGCLVFVLMGCASSKPMNDAAAWRYTQAQLKDSQEDLGIGVKRSYYPIQIENPQAYERIFMERVNATKRQVGHLSEQDVKTARDEAESIWKAQPR